MKNEHEVLFQPIKIGGTEIKNRFLMCPMEGTNLLECAMKYEFNEVCRELYIERAKSDVGLFVCGMVPVKSYFGKDWLYQQEKIFQGPVRELMDELHKYGSKFFIQIGAGMGRSMSMIAPLRKMYYSPKPIKGLMKLVGLDVNKMLLAPTAGMPNVWAPDIKTIEITKQEIYDIIDGYAKAAKLAKDNGVDGVEIHAIHEGYLLDQFTWALTNKRTDEFGGSLENRLRFTTEIIKKIKELCGKDYPVSVRYSVVTKIKGFNDPALPGEKFKEAGRDYEESIKAAQLLEAAGCDLLNADNGSYDSWFWAHPPMYMPLACNLEDSTFIKKHVSIPVACAGRMEDMDTSANAVSDGSIDIVALGRQFLCDGEFITKVKNEQFEDIRPCIACHNGCFPMARYKGEVCKKGAHHMGSCALNPRTLKEKTHTLTEAEVKKHIVVIGGGIGGMEAARVCAIRGHKVDLYEKSDKLGGIFIAASAPSFKEKERELIEWYRRQMVKLGVNVHLNSEVTSLDGLNADEVFVATGTTAKKLPIPGADGANVMEATEYLLGKKEAGERVAVVGGAITGIEIAYDLALKGKKPYVIEMQDDILKVDEMCAANSNFLRAALAYYNVPVYTETQLAEINGEGVKIKNADGEQTLAADSVILSIGYNSYVPFAAGEHIHVVGDAAGVGNLMTVIWPIYEKAMKL